MTALATAIKEIEREYGKGSILKLRDAPRQSVDVVSTGALTLDIALGVGGMPLGRVVEIYGPESSGKTTIVQHVIANAQAQGLNCAFIDAEHCFDPTYAEATGIDTGKLYFAQPDYGEQALEICARILETGELGVIAIDSVAALTPRAELEGEMGQAHVGEQARMMGKAMRKMVGLAQRSNTLLIFTNQIREKIGVMFGSPETQPGGRALKFAASQRLDIRRIATDKDKSGDPYQNRVRVKVVKNKVAAPYKQAEFDIVFGTGVDTLGELVDLGVDQGVVQKSGSWFTIEDERTQGKDKARVALAQKPDLQTTIRTTALENL
jgi:recombination protein RecA